MNHFLFSHSAASTHPAAFFLLRTARLLIAIAAAFAGLLAAAAGPFYQQTNLVSDLPGLARVTDGHLIAAWGAVHSATSAWWVASPLGGVSTVYDGNGQPVPAASPLVVSIPAPAGMTIPSIPTGLVANGGSGFELTPKHPARFIFVTRTGTVSGWNPQVNPTAAIIMVEHPGVADYTGITLASRHGIDRLYVANFGQGRVDVFDSSFQPVSLPAGSFVDPEVPGTFRVFNIQVVRDEFYVTYAPQAIFDATAGGPGEGFVTVFDANGRVLRHLKRGPWMNAPWGVTLAPDDFGNFGGDILIGMFGDGGIAAFDPEKGNFHGLLRGTPARPLTLGRGLWGLEFGNGGAAGPSDTLYFATDVAVGDSLHGLFGTLTPLPRGSDDDDPDYSN